MLMLVNPGTVFTSLPVASPSSPTKKSTRAYPSQPIARYIRRASSRTRSAASASMRAGTCRAVPESAAYLLS